MNYLSTRGGAEKLSSAAAIKQGIASDGGLFMPENIPSLSRSDIVALCKKSYPERAAHILSLFLKDYTSDELIADCSAAYGGRFDGYPAPVTRLGDNLSILELWHGPTCAFKDMALQIMPRLLSRALDKTGERRDAFILVATSGDTGKAALEGYRDAPRVRIIVYYPADGVSLIQKLQMATQEGENVSVRSVKGNFDDTQNGVKKIFGDPAAAETLSERGYFLSSANSINWGRLAPQVVYYFSAYCDLANGGSIAIGDSVNFCVPTGNFGNIFAAYLAKKAGLPVEKLICASNRNNILTDFFTDGSYDRRRRFYTTMSPSMDILISSNLERLLYLLAGSEATSRYMSLLSQNGFYDVDETIKTELKNGFYADWCGEEETSAEIKNIFNKYNYLIDPHTAVGVKCASDYIKKTGDTRPMIAVSTASPYKFASDVYRSVAGRREKDEFKNIEKLSALTKTEVPASLASLCQKKIRFDPERAIEAADMKKYLLSLV